MQGARPVIACLLAALALSGCMRRTSPVAVAPQTSLDTIAYGQTYAPAPVAVAYAEPAPVRYDSAYHLVCRLLLEKKKYDQEYFTHTNEMTTASSISHAVMIAAD